MAVQSADDMSQETFIKHINARHTPISGMTEFKKSHRDPDEKLLRRYHQHAHHRGEDGPGRPVNHEHSEPKETQ